MALATTREPVRLPAAGATLAGNLFRPAPTVDAAVDRAADHVAGHLPRSNP